MKQRHASRPLPVQRGASMPHANKSRTLLRGPIGVSRRLPAHKPAKQKAHLQAA
jgi:hypothetical protein